MRGERCGKNIGSVWQLLEVAFGLVASSRGGGLDGIGGRLRGRYSAVFIGRAGYVLRGDMCRWRGCFAGGTGGRVCGFHLSDHIIVIIKCKCSR